MKSNSRNKAGLNTWLVDLAGNVAISDIGLALLNRIKKLAVPDFVSTEQAIAWGSALNAEQRETLLHVQRTSSNAALVECNLQRMVHLATQSQLMREAAEASSESAFASGPMFAQMLPPNQSGSLN